MAIEVVTTPSAPDANSYASVQEADAYVRTYVLTESNRDAWLELEPDDKSRLLIQATRQIDWYFCWQGYRTVPEQPLEWPRYGVYKDGRYQIDPYTIPRELKDATFEMALWLGDQRDETPISGNSQFDMLQVGPIKIDFNENSGMPSKIYVPDKVVSILEGFGEAHLPDMPTNNRLKQARLIRG